MCLKLLCAGFAVGFNLQFKGSHMLLRQIFRAVSIALACAVTLACAITLGVLAQDKLPEKEKPKESAWQKLFREHATGYKLVIEGNEKSEVKLLADPILHWSQPVRGGAEGSVFLWVLEGRPVAIGTLFIWPMGNGKQGISHELHSLSQQPFVATWKDRKWTPPKDSIVWNSLSTPAPAKTAEQRLRQMREAARAFQAESRDKNERKWELRLLPKPIYQYEVAEKAASPANDVLEGAIFGFVEGTDLEVVLLVQARKTPQGAQWEYALARMSDLQLKVSLADKVVWEVDRCGFDNPHVPYYCSTVESRKSAEEE